MIHYKKCTKCGDVKEASTVYFYKHSPSKGGLSARCKPCVNDDNEFQKSKRMLRDPSREKSLASQRTMRNYRKDIEKSRERHRAAAAKRRLDPKKLEIINMRKRGGGARLTPSEFESLLKSQNYSCVICGESEEDGVKWNLDHCHITNDIRFILCNHCNRGLGAFKDNPDIMRKAADLISCFYSRYRYGPPEDQSQKAGAQPAIMEK